MTIPDKPLFSVEFSAASCGYSIQVNGIPAIEEVSGDSLTGELPVNSSIIAGVNKLRLLVSPSEGKSGVPVDGGCRATLSVGPRFRGKGPDLRQVIVDIRYGDGKVGFHSTAAGGVVVESLGEGCVAGSVRAEIASPFPRWFWQDAAILQPGASLQQSFLHDYMEFWSLLQKRDIAAVMAATERKAGEFRKAYYFTDLEEAYRAIGLVPLLRNTDAELLPFPTTEVHVDIVGDGRLARLLTATHESPIAFRERDPGFRSYMNAVYCHKGGRWVQIR